MYTNFPLLPILSFRAAFRYIPNVKKINNKDNPSDRTSQNNLYFL